MKNRKTAVLLLALTLAVTGCGSTKNEASVSGAVSHSDAGELSSAVAVSSLVSEAEPIDAETVEEEPAVIAPEGMMVSYLTGEFVDETIGSKRPIAVMLNNIQAAVPQSGIAKAGVVYEAPVEGGITRLMGLFEDYSDLEKIGSVRSARVYYANLAQGWNAIYCCYGHSKYIADFLSSPTTDAMDGVSSTGAGVFYRTDDRKAPHNAYTSYDGIQTGIERLGISTEYRADYDGYFNYAAPDDTVSYEGKDAYTVTLPYTHNHPYFTYNADDQLYYRFQFGEEQIDDLTGEQLAFKNLVLQYCDYTMFDDGKSLNIDYQSGGKGMYICNGTATELTWSFDPSTKIEHYYLADGTELKLNTGKTFVALVTDPSGVQILAEGEQAQTSSGETE